MDLQLEYLAEWNLVNKRFQNEFRLYYEYSVIDPKCCPHKVFKQAGKMGTKHFLKQCKASGLKVGSPTNHIALLVMNCIEFVCVYHACESDFGI